MLRWERRLVVIVISLGLSIGCGSEEAAPPLAPAPPELPAPSETPTPETPTEPEADPTPELETETVEVVAPTEAPVAPVISGEATEAPPMPDFDEVEHTRATFEMSHGTTSYDEVAYPPAVQGALLRHLRATMRDLLDGFVASPETDDDMGSYYDASCVANLALPEMVAYTCVRTITEGRGDMEIVAATKLYAISGESVRELEADDFLIPGTDLDELADRYELEPSGPMTLTASGIGFVDQDGEMAEVPYVDLGALIDPRSAAGRVPGVAAIAAVTTQLALAAGPPESIPVLTPARPLPAAAILAASERANWIFADVPGAAVAAGTPMVVAAGEALPTGTSRLERPWSTPLRVLRARLHRAAQLRDAPRRPGAGPSLPAGTVLYAVLGDTGAGPSRTGGGQWTLVAVSEGRAGWLPSALVRDTDAAVATPSVEAFLASLPETDRSAARASCIAIESGGGFVLVSPRGNETLVGFTPRPTYGAAPTNRLVLTHPGVLLDAQVAGPTHAGDSNSPLVVLTWSIEGDDAHVRVEVIAARSSAAAPPAPVLTLTLASSSAPARERQSVATGVTRRGRYAPLVVRGPGRAETRYTWNGTALVPESE